MAPSLMFNYFSNFFNINQNKQEYKIHLIYNKFISLSKLRYNLVELVYLIN